LLFATQTQSFPDNTFQAVNFYQHSLANKTHLQIV
jgi:hypothetical protein